MSIESTDSVEEGGIESGDKELKVVNIHDIEAPSKSEKLHPGTKERDEPNIGEVTSDGEAKDDHAWEQFKQSVGTQPHNNPVVIPDGDGYRLFTGDRRLRAVKENYEEQGTPQDQQTLIVEVDHSIETEEEVIRGRIEENEFRKGNDKEARARALAQLCAPWLLPPGDRKDDIEPKSQSEVGRDIGHEQAVISQWLDPLRDDQQIRDALAHTTANNSPSADQTETIDDLEPLLRPPSGILDKPKVGFFKEELKGMAKGRNGPSLDEVESAVRKADNKGWDTRRLLQYIETHYTPNEKKEESPDDVQSGMLDGSADPFEDNSEKEIYDTDGDTGIRTEVEEETDEEDGRSIGDIAQHIQEQEWEKVVDEAELDGSLSEYERQKMVPVDQDFEGDAAVAIHLLCDYYNTDKESLMKEFIQPLFVDQAVAVLRDRE